ncbi:hypothetical protein [Acinetobacter variabilis]|uniref:hypothetical protein n=1 Tax=Acinetobacter variabilis TaxID=70346 RepID=UPI00254FAF46|nr:hypothetical protein [Acinetobacter variabilis]
MFNSNLTSNDTQIETNKLILELKRVIEKEFNASDWSEIALLVNADQIVHNHPRLLRSLSFGDDDYGANIIDVLRAISLKNPHYLQTIKDYLDHKYYDENTLYVSHQVATNKITFSPSVFSVPSVNLENDLIAVMMPFSGFDGVYSSIKEAAKGSNFRCLRADDIWDNSTIIQDIFDLIFRARVVIVDFSGKNPNVMYETGIAHTLSKLVIPIAQSVSDIPSDMIHHRSLIYLKNGEGLKNLESELCKKLTQLNYH